MSWATPVRSHVVVTTMARSITVERSVPALLGLARVSGLGMGVFVVSGLGGGPPRIFSRRFLVFLKSLLAPLRCQKEKLLQYAVI